MLREERITREFIDTRSVTAAKVPHILLDEDLLKLIANDVRMFGLVASQQEWA